ncbi:MAG TPA: hypothetical protein VGM90_20000 [Kofleriaceae bacterium]|jgi:hypothetical protein
MRGLLLVLALAGCSIDHGIESARKDVLALDATHARAITAWCKTWHKEELLSVSDFPKMLPAQPTTIDARGGVIELQWWNNSHYEEDDPHPGFVLTCSDHTVEGAKQIAEGLWYRDSPMNGP